MKNANRLSVVLVSPMHEVNIGLTARAMHNFGVHRLFIAGARTQIGFTTRVFAKRGWSIVERAFKTNSFKQALRRAESDCAIAFTGVPSRYRSRLLKHCITLEEAIAKTRRIKRLALVFGPEDKGLNEDEIAACDLTAFIPAGEHPVLSLSHAVAIALYEFVKGRREHGARGAVGTRGALVRRELYAVASRKELKTLTKLFEEKLAREPGVRDKRKVALAFKRVLERAVPAREEVRALYAFFGKRRQGSE